MAGYKEDPYQHIVRIRINFRRLLIVNISDLDDGAVFVSGAAPYTYLVGNSGYRIFDVSGAPTSVIFSNLIGDAAPENSSDSASAVVHDFQYSLSGRSLEEIIQSGDYETDAVFGGPGDMQQIAGGDHTAWPSFSGSVFTFDSDGRLTSETNTLTGVTTTYDPPI